jgi:hypothetical protein
MRSSALILCSASTLCAAPAVFVSFSPAGADDFVPLFDGVSLKGWVNVNCAPGTFTMRDGEIRSTGVPTGLLRTEKQYENFVLELEWMHEKPGGNAGLFVWSDPLTAVGTPFARAVEVQILDGRESADYTSHGDVFSIHGAVMKPDRPHPNGWMRCLPSEKRAKPAGEWNHYRVECRDGVIQLAVNGKVVSGGSACKPRKGYICLESEGSPARFRALRIHELPSTDPSPDEVAPLAEDFVPLYTGVDLVGWKAEPDRAKRWQLRNWVLRCDGEGKSEGEAAAAPLWTEREFGDFVLVADWKLPSKVPSGRSGIVLRGSTKCELDLWCLGVGSGGVSGFRDDAGLAADVRAALTPKLRADARPGQWNRIEVTLEGDRLTVVLNTKKVVDAARLPGLPARGAIGLVDRGDAVEFANVFVREVRP